VPTIQSTTTPTGGLRTQALEASQTIRHPADTQRQYTAEVRHSRLHNSSHIGTTHHGGVHNEQAITQLQSLHTVLIRSTTPVQHSRRISKNPGTISFEKNHRMAKQPRTTTKHQYCHTIPRQPRISAPGTVFLAKHHQRQHPMSTPITPTSP
jgi:hypothetical protein